MLQEADLPPQRRGLEELLALAALRFPAAPEADSGSAEVGAEPAGAAPAPEPAGAAPAPLPPAELDEALQRGALLSSTILEWSLEKCCASMVCQHTLCHGYCCLETISLSIDACLCRQHGCSAPKGKREHVRPELEEAIAASLADAEAGGARPGGPPPAAAYAVRALRTEALTPERLAALGGPGVECCVCRHCPAAILLCRFWWC